MKTSTTPGTANAFSRPMEKMRACACGERSTLMYRSPSIGATSMVYRARPVTIASANGFGRLEPQAWPATSASTALMPTSASLMAR